MVMKELNKRGVGEKPAGVDSVQGEAVGNLAKDGMMEELAQFGAMEELAQLGAVEELAQHGAVEMHVEVMVGQMATETRQQQGLKLVRMEVSKKIIEQRSVSGN